MWHMPVNISSDTTDAVLLYLPPTPTPHPTQRPVTRSFDVYFDLSQNKRLSKQSWGWWFETLSPSIMTSS